MIDDINDKFEENMVKGGGMGSATTLPAATPVPAKKPVDDNKAPARASSVMNMSHGNLGDASEKFTMPAILNNKNYSKFKKIGHIRNIYMQKDPPLFVKFERFGK